MNFIIAQCLGVIGPLLKIIGIQFKDKTRILFMFTLVNLVIAIELLLLKAFTGATVCLVSAIETFINYLYLKKGKELPKLFIPIYILIAIIVGIITYREFMDLLAIICSLLYILSICQKKEKNIRIISNISMVIWVVYNIYFMAYLDACFKVGFIISDIISIYRYDIRQKNT